MNYGNKLICKTRWGCLFYSIFVTAIALGGDNFKGDSNHECMRVSVVADLVQSGKMSRFRDESGEKIWVDCHIEIKRGNHQSMDLSGKISLQGASNLTVSPKNNYRVKLTKGA